MTGYNFTERVRQVLQNARLEAQSLHHEYVGTEHVLLGMLRATDSVACQTLMNLSIDTEALRQSILEVVKKGKAAGLEREDLPYTSRAKKVLELAMSEARDLKHNYVGTEHLLLGLLREEKGIAAQVLAHHGVTKDAARAQVLRIKDERGAEPLRSGVAADQAPVSRPVRTPRRPAHQIALVTLWWTLGIVLLIESVRPFVRDMTGTEQITPHLSVLAGFEIVGALLFLFPRTLKYGAWILLAVFAVAIVTHLARGEFPAPLLVYAAGTIFVLVQRTGGVLVMPRKEPS